MAMESVQPREVAMDKTVRKQEYAKAASVSAYLATGLPDPRICNYMPLHECDILEA